MYREKRGLTYANPQRQLRESMNPAQPFYWDNTRLNCVGYVRIDDKSVKSNMIHASTTGDTMNYTQHALTQAAHSRLSKRAQAGADFLLCLAIGVGLAALLVAWWSS